MNDEKYEANDGRENPFVKQARDAMANAATTIKDGISRMNVQGLMDNSRFQRLNKESSNITIPVRVIKQDRLREIIGEICGVYVDVVGQTYGPGG